MTVKETLKTIEKENGIRFPLTIRKIENVGWTVKDFLGEVRKRILKADDIGEKKALVEDFLFWCEKAIAEE